MKLGIGIGYSGAQMAVPIDVIRRAEELGYDSVWTAEAYGSDALSPLAYIAALTSRIRLGSGVIQLAARTPANAAMTTATIDAMSGGRMVCGIGVSGPQIVEGWYGEPWGKPMDRLRDYIAIMRKIYAREEPVTHDGLEISLPYTGEGSSGLGKPLRSILHPRKDIPIWMGSLSPGGVRLAGEIADGLLGGGSPKDWPATRALLEEGFAKAGNGKSMDDFEVMTMANVMVTDDVKTAIDSLKPGVALYVGGMGAKSKNFHAQRMAARGYPDEAQRIQELFLAGRKDEATAAVPDEFIDEDALIGPPARIREKFKPWEESGMHGITISGRNPEAIELMAEITGSAKRVKA